MRTHLEIVKLEAKRDRLLSRLRPYFGMTLPLSEGDLEIFETISRDLGLADAKIALLKGKEEMDRTFLARPTPGAESAGLTEPGVGLVTASEAGDLSFTPEEMERERADLRAEDEARRYRRRDHSLQWLTLFPEPFLLQVWFTPEPGKVEPERFIKITRDYEKVAHVRARSMEEAWHLCQNTPGPWQLRLDPGGPAMIGGSRPFDLDTIPRNFVIGSDAVPGNFVIEAYTATGGLPVLRNLGPGDVLVNLRTYNFYMVDEALEKLTFHLLN